MKKILAGLGLAGIIATAATLPRIISPPKTVDSSYFTYKIPSSFKAIAFDYHQSSRPRRQGHYDPLTHRVYILTNDARNIAEIWVPRERKENIFESIQDVQKITSKDPEYASLMDILRR